MKIQVRLDEKEFMKFSWFDALRCKKIWRRPALFASILGTAAVACFVLHERRGAVLLGSVLLAVALGLPAAYFSSFFLSLRTQSVGLAAGKYVYTLELRNEDQGIIVENGNERAVYSWKQVFHAYHNGTASYLYITPQQAFLIPHDCVRGNMDDLWKLIKLRIPKDRWTVL